MDGSGEQDGKRNGEHQLSQLYSELTRASARYPRKKDWMLGMIVVLLLFIPIAEAFTINGALTPLLPFPYNMVCYVIIMAAILYFALRRIKAEIKKYNAELPTLIRRAGLIERLALGAGELPDIFAYTMFPWRLFLGSRPTTFSRQARLLAYNLDWYLLPEPKRHFRFIWLWYVMSACIILVGLRPFWINLLQQANLALALQFLSTDGSAYMYLLWVGMLVLVPLQGFELNRLVESAEALRKEVQLRILNADGELFTELPD